MPLINFEFLFINIFIFHWGLFYFASLIRSKIFAINSRFSFKLSMGNSSMEGKKMKRFFSIKPAGWKKFMLTLQGWKLAGKLSVQARSLNWYCIPLTSLFISFSRDPRCLIWEEKSRAKLNTKLFFGLKG